MREELLAFVSQRGTLLEPDAVEFLLSQRDPIARLEGFLVTCQETPFVVTLENVMQAGEIARAAAKKVQARPNLPALSAVVYVPASFRRLGEPAGDRDPDVRSLRDITGHSTCEAPWRTSPATSGTGFRSFGTCSAPDTNSWGRRKSRKHAGRPGKSGSSASSPTSGRRRTGIASWTSRTTRNKSRSCCLPSPPSWMRSSGSSVR